MSTIRQLFSATVLATVFFVLPVKAQTVETDVLRHAKVMVEAGRFKEAVSVLKTYEPQDRSEELAIHLMTGKIYLSLDRPARALEYFEKAFEQDIENFDAAIGAATASMKLGQFTQARQYLVQAGRR